MSEQREAGRELDAEVAERVFGWGSCEYDTGGARVAGLSYLLVDDRPRPWMHFTSNAAADYTVLKHVRATWSFDARASFAWALRELWAGRVRESDGHTPVEPTMYEPGDYSLAALAATDRDA